MIMLLQRYWRPLAEILFIAALFWGYGYFQYQAGQVASDTAWRLKWSERDRDDAQALARQQAAARTEEQRRQQAITRITQNAQQQVTAARADAAGAADSIERLQHTITELQRKQRSAARHPGIISTGPAGGTAADMQTELLRESLERSRALAAEADRRRIAGLACEQSYDALIINQASQSRGFFLRIVRALSTRVFQ